MEFNEVTPDDRRQVIEDTLFGPDPTLDFGLVSPQVDGLVTDLLDAVTLAIKSLKALCSSTDESISLAASEAILNFGYSLMVATEEDEDD